MVPDAASTFSTPRLRAEQLRSDHAEYLAQLHTDAAVMALIGGVRDSDTSAEWLRRNLECWEENGFGQWMLRDTTGQLVGRGGLRWIDPSVGERIVELGYVFQRSAWRAGLATEASNAIIAVARDHYRLTQLGAITLVSNDASSRVLTKCGFRFERMVEHPIGPHRFFRLTL